MATPNRIRSLLQKCGGVIELAEDINWVKLWWVVGIVLTIWLGLVTLLPPAVYKPVAVILAALQSAFLFAAKGSRYAKTNTLPPEGGQQ